MKRVIGPVSVGGARALLLALGMLVLTSSAGAQGEPSEKSVAAAVQSAADSLSPRVDAEIYVDDRSDAVAVLRSYVNAINRREYVRAYGYWEPEAAATQLPPFEQFAQGFADTRAVQLVAGPARGDAGAGQLYHAVPVLLLAETADGATQTFIGCYQLHLAQPVVQALPPFRPLSIRSAAVREVPGGVRLANPATYPCGPT